MFQIALASQLGATIHLGIFSSRYAQVRKFIQMGFFSTFCKLYSFSILGTEIDGTTDQIMEEDGVRVQVDTIVVPHSEDFLVGEVVAEEFLVEHVLPLDSGAPVEDRYVLMYL